MPNFKHIYYLLTQIYYGLNELNTFNDVGIIIQPTTALISVLN